MTAVPSPEAAGPTRRNGVIWVAFGASLWGFDTVLRQPLTASLSSSTIVFYEHVFLSLALAAVAWRNRAEWLAFRPVHWLAVIWIAWGGSALGTISYTYAIKLGNPTTVVFLQKLQPFVAVFLARVWLREHEPREAAFWLRFTVAVGAAFLISFGGGGHWGIEGGLFAFSSFWALAAAAIWGSCTVVGRYLIPKTSVSVLTSLRVICALPLLTVLVVAGRADMSIPGVAAEDFGSLLLIALVPGLLGLLFYYRGLRGTHASLATLAELCFPAAAAVLNWVFLGAEVTPWQLAGVALLWGAVLWKRSRPRVVRESQAGA